MAASPSEAAQKVSYKFPSRPKELETDTPTIPMQSPTVQKDYDQPLQASPKTSPEALDEVFSKIDEIEARGKSFADTASMELTKIHQDVQEHKKAMDASRETHEIATMESGPVQVKQVRLNDLPEKKSLVKTKTELKKAALTMVNQYQKRSTYIFFLTIGMIIILMISAVQCYQGGSGKQGPQGENYDEYLQVPGMDDPLVIGGGLQQDYSLTNDMETGLEN